ncbi:unnamed protein product [Phytophthora lilii]|uniref:Unnamed protein product n=1 Tax=Phytophthora lilii TaxID=2077276 RepID=A0A9W6UAC5_9STRA|nr:unnamed protein product [Phytophthora lilii]
MPPERSKQQDLYAKLHLGLDHVLARLLLEAPPLPPALKLQTETQAVGATWVQVTEAFEKRRAMLQRRKEKKKAKSKKAKEKTVKKNKSKEKEPEKETKTKTKSRTTSASPRAKAEKKSQKKTTSSPKVLKLESNAAPKQVPPDAYNASLLKKLRRLPMCENVQYGTNKYKAIVRWMELDKGKDAGAPPGLVDLLANLQQDAKQETQNKPKLTRKRSLESLDDTLRAEKSNKRKSPSSGRRRSEKQRAPYVDEDEVVYESGDEEEEPEYDGSYSDSDEAEFVPELGDSPPPENPKKREAKRPAKRQKQETREEKTDKQTPTAKTSTSQKTSKEQLAAVVAKIRADEVASGKGDTKYLSYEKTKPGATSNSAIVLDDSDDEDEEEEEETKDEDSSTDDDQDMFDLNEEDVYVVEAILCVKEGRSLLTAGVKRKEADLYLVKWDGYNELTWEPDENIPRRLIEMFRERERAKRACQYQIKVAHERRVVTNVTTQTQEVIYMIQWINQDSAVWESRSTLPTKTQVWLDKVLGVAPTKKRRETKAAKQYIYQ